MRFSLKNRPKLYKNCMSVFHKDAIRWFEGFEAELRERLKRKKYAEKGYCPVWDNGYDYAIKEILAE